MKLAFLALGLALVVACKKPEPPHIVPKEARVAAVSPAGVDIVVKVEATNPNTVTLSARSFTGKAKLDGKYDLAMVTVERPIVLPPQQPTMLEVPMTLPWSDMNALATLATAQKPVPYVIDGSVTVGGESLNVTLPYSLSGTIAREQLIAAAMRGLPTLIPPVPAPAPAPPR
ncbi:MAG: LEA type 2 family protein [Labilithrix sp.]|nr:LEA type 2 family protein [Labilithrix sp.]MCW5817071.1 LEA type 2 family protein [Labilithrix sp.]